MKPLQNNLIKKIENCEKGKKMKKKKLFPLYQEIWDEWDETCSKDVEDRVVDVEKMTPEERKDYLEQLLYARSQIC